MKRSRLLVPGLSVLAATAVFALSGPFGGPTAGAQPAGSGAPQFDAKFETASDFYDRFDYGYSGFSPWEWNGGGNNGAITEFHGDHNEQCEAPTTQRTVTFGTADEPDLSAVVLALRARRRSRQGPPHDRGRHARLQHRLVQPEARVHQRVTGVLGHERDGHVAPQVDAGPLRRPRRRHPLPVDALDRVATTSATRAPTSARTHRTPGSSPRAARSPG